MTLLIHVYYPTVGGKRTSGQYWHKCAVPTTWKVIHKWKMLAKYISHGNAASDYNTRGASTHPRAHTHTVLMTGDLGLNVRAVMP
jgi:hypothetical protein